MTVKRSRWLFIEVQYMHWTYQVGVKGNPRFTMMHPTVEQSTTVNYELR